MKFIHGKPAAAIGKTLLIADLHLGFEYELRQKGVLVELQYRAVAKEINALLKQTRCTELVVIGDAKHDVYGFEDKEQRMMRAFFSLVKVKATVVKGNHDSQLEKLEGIRVTKPEGILMRDVLLLHGHALPKEEDLKKAKTILMAHEHPLIELGEKKYKWSDKAWIIGRHSGKRFVIFPHFGRLISGRPFNKGGHLTPLLSQEECDDAEAIMLNGARLGKVGNL